MSKRHRLGDLQLRIMDVLWNRGECTVGTVHRDLESGGDLAYTTIATMLQKMEKRGLVRRRMEGRRGVYRALIESTDVRTSMVDDLVERLFHGDLEAMVDHLLTSRDVSGDELQRLSRIIAERKSADGELEASEGTARDGGGEES